MARLQSTLRISLEDRVSAEARAVTRSVQQMEDAADAQRRAMDNARGRMLDAVAVGWAAYEAFSAPTEAAVDFERQLENVRQKADLTREAVAQLGREAREVGLDTAQGANRIASAIDVLLGTGLFDEAQALTISSPLGRVATAYEADTTEVANATAALVGNMHVGVTEVEAAYDMMAQSGKEGMFELKDMAAEFPALAAAAASIGLSGTEGLADLLGALQVARMGAGSGSEAATNTANYMNKIMAPDAIKKFGETGVDIVSEMRDAAEAGLSPLERSLEVLNELTEGGKQELLGQYFADAEVQKFLRPLLANMEEYRRIRQEALDAEGVVQADFESRLETPGGAIARFQASVENLNLVVGQALLPKLTEFIDNVTPMVDGVARFVEANDELVGAILSMTAAIIALRVAAAGLGFAGAFLGMGKRGGGALGLPGVGSAGGGASAAGPRTGARTSPNLGGWGLLGFNALGIGSDVAAFGEAVQNDAGQAWIAERNARDKAMNDWLLGLDLWGVKPFQAMQDVSDIFNRPDTGRGIGGGYTGATQGQIDAMKAEIAELDREIAEWPEEGLEVRRASLVEKLAAMEAELASSGSTITADFEAMLSRMRVAAAAGITIPIRTAGPALPQAPDRTLPGFASGGWVWGAGTGTSDDILAWLSDGEYVVDAATAQRHAGLLESMSSGTLSGADLIAGGGARGSGPVTFSGPLIGTVHINNMADVDHLIEEMGRRLRGVISGVQADIEYGGV